MIQKTVVRIKLKDGQILKEGDVLTYDEKEDCYYVTSIDTLLSVQNKKIADLKSNYEEFINKYIAKFEEFESNYKNFLSTYKKTNDKLIKMVESFIKEN